MVDIATHFSAACFLRTQFSADTWKEIMANWLYVYAGPADTIQVDQDSAYVSNEMRSNCEGYWDSGWVPQAPQNLWEEMAGKIKESECLRMAIFAIILTVGPEVLCPILFVYGLIPLTVRKMPAENQIMRTHVLERGMAVAERH